MTRETGCRRSIPLLRRLARDFAIGATLSSAALAGSAAPAHGATVLAQTGPANNGGVASSSDIRTYDDFRLDTGASINQIAWTMSTLFGRVTGNFSIVFATTQGLFPGSVLYSANVTATSTNAGDFTQAFTVDLPTTVTLPGNTDLFLSIYRTDGQFYWGRADDTPTSPGVSSSTPWRAFAVSNDSSGWEIQTANLAWSLGGTSIVAGGIPEPATWALIIIGMGLVAGAMRRNHRRPRPAKSSPIATKETWCEV